MSRPTASCSLMYGTIFLYPYFVIFDKSSAAIEFDEELVDAIAGFNLPFTFIIRY